jgi:hypothetical protein
MSEVFHARTMPTELSGGMLHVEAHELGFGAPWEWPELFAGPGPSPVWRLIALRHSEADYTCISGSAPDVRVYDG